MLNRMSRSGAAWLLALMLAGVVVAGCERKSGAATGADDSAYVPEDPKEKVAPEGVFPGRSAMNIYLWYEVHMAVMVRHVNGKPLPTEVIMGMAKRLRSEGTRAAFDVQMSIDSEMRVGKQQAQDGYIMGPHEFRRLVGEMVERYDTLNMDQSAEDVIKVIAKFTKVSEDRWEKQYRMGK
jgi:hypothetical protein